MLKIGLLGASRIAPKAIIPQVAARDDCVITAVACRDEDRGKAYADAHGIADVETSYEALCARDDLDIIYNALPPIAHRDLTIQALKAGKHVLCEKPFAMNAREASAMAEAAQESDRVLMEAFHYRFHAAFIRVLDILKQGRIGAVREMMGTFTVSIPDRDGELRHDPALGGGALMDLGCYPVHACRMIAGGEPIIHSARAEDNGKGADLALEATLLFDEGVSAQIITSMAADAEFEASVKVFGENGTLTFANFVHPQKGHAIKVFVEGGETSETIDGPDTYTAQLDHFIDVVANGTAPLLTPDDAVRQMLVLDAIYREAGYDR